MPAKSKSRIGSLAKAKIAAGKLTGVPAKQIAAETGVSESRINHLGRDPEVRDVMRRILADNQDELSSLFAASCKSLKQDLQAPKFDERERARTQSLKFIELGQSKDSAGTPGAAAGAGAPLLDVLTTYRQLVTMAPSVIAEDGA